MQVGGTPRSRLRIANQSRKETLCPSIKHQRVLPLVIHPQVQRHRGFTLIELVVVLAVLGALSAVAIPRLTGLGDEAQLEAVAARASSEINNVFARDLAAGSDGGSLAGSPVDWSPGGNACQSVNNYGNDENAAEVIFESLIGFWIWPGPKAPSLQSGYSYQEITVPNYQDGEVGSRTCYIYNRAARP